MVRDGLSAATKRKMVETLRKKEPEASATVNKHRPGKRFKGAQPTANEPDSDSDSSSSSSSKSKDSEKELDAGVHNSIEIKWPATVLLIGKRFCGKTNAILNIVDKNDFDNVWVITTTKHKNNLNELVIDDGEGDPMDQVLESLSEAFLYELIEHQKKTDAKTLLIFDDFIGIKGIKLRHSDNMKLLASSGRNFNVSIVFSSQDAVEISKTFRRNPEYVMIGDNDEDAVDLMAKTMASVTIPKATMREKIAEVCRKDYHFLYIDRREKISYPVKFPLVKE